MTQRTSEVSNSRRVDRVVLLSESGSLDGWQRLGDVLDDRGFRLMLFDGVSLPPPDVCDAVEFFVAPFIRAFGDGSILRSFPGLRVVQTLTAGFDHVARALPPGVTLCSAGGVNAHAVAEVAVGLAITSRRELDRHIVEVREGMWNEADASPGLAGRTVAVVGYGSIGRVLVDTLEALGCTVTVVARSAREEQTATGTRRIVAISDLDRLLPGQDVVILAVPSTPATTGLFNGPRLARMRDDALLVNVARGDLVDSEAFVAELRSGRLRGAVDVWSPEPPDRSVRDLPLDRLLMTPHIGGNSTTVRAARTALLHRQLSRFVDGEPLLNVVRVGDGS